MVVEGNVGTTSPATPSHLHYGKENTVRGNVLTFGGSGQVAVSRPEPHGQATVERNVLLGRSAPAFVGAVGDRSVARFGVVSDLNLIWDTERAAAVLPRPVADRRHLT